MGKPTTYHVFVGALEVGPPPPGQPPFFLGGGNYSSLLHAGRPDLPHTYLPILLGANKEGGVPNFMCFARLSPF